MATIGEEVKQAAVLDGGIFAHQIRTTPANDAAILVTRGNDAAAGKPEDPGALKVFSFKDGQLANRASIAPNGGYGFGPRHLDFHPTLPVVYVSRERENKLDVYRLTNGTLDPQPIFVKDTLAEPGNIRSRQAASTVHVHPNGRLVYVSNRAFDTVDFEGKKIFPGGENNIAVFAIDPVDRRAGADPERGRARHLSRAHSRSIRAGACWSSPTSNRCWCAMAPG